jgi:hypothetical protein
MLKPPFQQVRSGAALQLVDLRLVSAQLQSLFVLELKAPHERELAALTRLLPNFLSHVLSFVVVAIYWVNHHHLINLAQKVDGGIFWANIHLPNSDGLDRAELNPGIISSEP